MTVVTKKQGLPNYEQLTIITTQHFYKDGTISTEVKKNKCLA